MTDRMIAVRSDLADRLEEKAREEGRSVNDVLGELLEQPAQHPRSNWALAVAKGMEAANIDWIEDPDASMNSRKHYKQYLQDKWERTQSDTE